MATIENYDNVFNGCNITNERLERLQIEILENMPADPFKEYLLDELLKIQLALLDTQQVFNEGYCQDPNEKQFFNEKLNEKMDSINGFLKKDGPKL